MKSPKDLLSNVSAYVGLQKAVGADKLRHRCIDAADIQPHDVVIDVGCGPAYYFERLWQPITYHGFDTDQGYIDWARAKWGDRATFHCGVFDEEAAADLPTPNVVFLLGLLHHLSDEQSRDLLRLTADILAPGGRVISVDTAFVTNQGRISRWMSENDRGEFVRRPEQFTELAEREFGTVQGRVLSLERLIPGSHWMMRMSDPR